VDLMSWAPEPPAPRSLTREIGARKWSIALIAALAVVSALFFAFRQPPMYAAEARVLVKSVEPVEGQAVVPAPNMATEQEIAASPEVARAVRDQLGQGVAASSLLDDLSIENPPDTEVLIFTFTDADPTVARDGAQAFADEYVGLRDRGAIEAQAESMAEIRARIADLAEELRRVDRRIDDASNEVAVESLVSRADLLTGLLVQQKQGLVALQAAPHVAELFQPAVVLGRVVPSYARNAVVALLLGLALGVAQAGLRGRLDDRLRSISEAEPYLRSSALALIPSLPELDKKGSKRGSTIALSDIPASSSDAFVPLRVSFMAAASMRDATVFVVTSASREDGRSTITAHLARSLALAGRRVTVICADPARHRLERLVAGESEVGLKQVLEGSVPLSQALLPSMVGNVSVLPCGSPIGDDIDLSRYPDMDALLHSIRERSSVVLVDAPPIGDPDAVSLLPFVDGVLFVVDCRRMHGRTLAVARRQLDRMHVDLLGIVFNRATASVMKPQPHSLVAAGSSKP
jgi:Mrp family chromosome partitioning ATPase